MSEAFGGLDINDLVFEGEALRVDVRNAIMSAVLLRTTDGAPTLTITLLDEYRTLLETGIFSTRISAQVDEHSFVLVKVARSGSIVTATFEAFEVVTLRLKDTPRKIAPGAMTRQQFIKELVSEVPGMNFVTPLYSGGPTKSELSRGTVGETVVIEFKTVPDRERVIEEEKEDTWAATGRLADEVQWTRFIRGPMEFVYTDQAGLLAGPPEIVLREMADEVVSIDFDYDIGQKTATATATVFADRWSVPPGARVSLGASLGPASGDNWFVQSIERSLFSQLATITLAQPKPSLPEPEDPPEIDVGDDEGADDAGAGAGAGAGEGPALNLPYPDTVLPEDNGWQWPTLRRYPVTSPFGPRNGKKHEGIDIGMPLDTPIVAARTGTVTFKGTMSGYGNTLEITGRQYRHRYAHVRQYLVERGQHVKRGQPVALSGGKPGEKGAGNSRGPHLHFEIRVGPGPTFMAVDPQKHLPK